MSSGSFGAVEIVAVGFPTKTVPEAIRSALVNVLSTGAVTLLDLAVIRRSTAGDIEVLEIENMGDDFDVTDLTATASGLASEEDLDVIAASVAPGDSALVLTVEHTWARELTSAARSAGAVLLAREYIPPAVVNAVAEAADAAGTSFGAGATTTESKNWE